MKKLAIPAFVAFLLLTACTVSSPYSEGGNSSSSSSVDAMMEASSITMSSSSEASSHAAMQTSSAPAVHASSASTIQKSSAAAMQQSSSKPVSEARVIEVSVKNWEFAPSVITVKKGEKVTLKLVGKEGIHGLAIPGLNINISAKAGETVTVNIPTDTAGEFSFFCSIPCGPGHESMTGKIIITA